MVTATLPLITEAKYKLKEEIYNTYMHLSLVDLLTFFICATKLPLGSCLCLLCDWKGLSIKGPRHSHQKSLRKTMHNQSTPSPGPADWIMGVHMTRVEPGSVLF